MSVNGVKKRFLTAMSGLGYKCSYLRYAGTDPEYFTFFIVNDSDTIYGDGGPLAAQYRIQLDSWSPRGLADADEHAKSLLLSAGFTYIRGHDTYEPDTKLFRRTQEFYYNEEE